MNKSYFGITGFTSAEMVKRMIDLLPDEPSRLFMVGVLASTKTLAGVPAKWPMRNVVPKAIPYIFQDDPRCLNLIHYHPSDGADWLSEMGKLVALAGPNLHGFQINTAWPNMQGLRAFRMVFPYLKIVLQIPEHAIAIASIVNVDFDSLVGNREGTWSDVVYQANNYAMRSYVDYILIDPSGGKGKEFDPAEGLSRVTLLRKAIALNNPVKLGIAGGLTAENLDRLDPFLLHEPDLCWDAEGGLRTSDDYFSLDKATDYVIKSLEIADRAEEMKVAL